MDNKLLTVHMKRTSPRQEMSCAERTGFSWKEKEVEENQSGVPRREKEGEKRGSGQPQRATRCSIERLRSAPHVLSPSLLVPLSFISHSIASPPLLLLLPPSLPRLYWPSVGYVTSSCSPCFCFYFVFCFYLYTVHPLCCGCS